MVKQYREDEDFPLPPGSREEEEDFPMPPKSVSQQTREAFSPPPPAAAASTFEAEGFADPTAAPIQATQREELPPKKVDQVQFKELTKAENLKTIKDYAIARFGKEGEQRKGESDQDYVKRWMTSMRQVEWNTTMNGVPELNWIYNAKQEDVLKAAKAHELYNKVPDWYEEGGQPGVRPFLESALSAVSDPSNLLGLGVGASARYIAARQGISNALGQRIKAATAGAAIEGTVGAAATAVDEQRKLKLDKTLRQDTLSQQKDQVEKALDFGVIDQERYNVLMADIQQDEKENEERTVTAGDIAFGTLVSAVLGGIEAGGAFRKPKVSTKQDLARVIATRTKTPEDVEVKKLVDAFDAQMEKTLTEFDIEEGRRTLDEVSEPTALTQAEIKRDISTRAINVARYVLTVDPSFSQTKLRVVAGEQKVSDAVRDVFMSIDNIDEDILDAALNKTGLTLKEFGQATRTTVADAAAIMQGYSHLAKVLKRAASLDPEAERIIDKMYGKQGGVSSIFGSLWNGTLRLERESKALVVSSIATTVRNVYGTVGGMSMESATRALDGTLLAFGSGFKALSEGGLKAGSEALTGGLNKMVKDSFNTFTYLTNAGITAEVTERLLAYNPKLQNMLFHTLQETGDQQLSKIARMANTFNIAQDTFFRRALFTGSVERQLRDVGLDMYQLMADGKNIPAPVLQRAAEDALKGTFSYMPKMMPKDANTVEAYGESLANIIVKGLERVPGGSLAVPFPRFMANAMAFQYRYSAFGSIAGAMDIIKSARKADPIEAERLYKEGRTKLFRGVVGTGMLMAAMAHRMDNQDSNWYEYTTEDGSTADIRAIFPLGPMFAVGDLLAKIVKGKGTDADVTGTIEAVVGMKMPAGSQASILNSLPEIFAGEEGKPMERFEKAMGKVLGDFATRAAQPFQPAFAFFEQFYEESQVARDPNVLTSDNLLLESAWNRVKVKVPGLKEDLPPALQYLRPGQEERVRAGEFFSVLSGVRVVPSANKIEKEFSTLNLEAFSFYGTAGDKIYDRALILNSGKFIDKFVGGLIESDRYKEMTSAQRKLAIKANMQYSLEIGRELTMAQLTVADRDRVDKMAFNKMTAMERRAINELYSLNNNGRTLDEDKAYDQVIRYAPLLDKYR